MTAVKVALSYREKVYAHKDADAGCGYNPALVRPKFCGFGPRHHRPENKASGSKNKDKGRESIGLQKRSPVCHKCLYQNIIVLGVHRG